jgi:16S rRNA (guanine527-N7)-methyltransferase
MATLQSTPFAAAALSIYRALLERHRDTLDLLSPTAHATLDRLLAEAEAYAAAVEAFAPDGGILDLGSGAGLPGVVVAAYLHPRAVWWVERRLRRATFLEQVAARAHLSAVRIVADDVRRMPRPDGGIAAVTAQAVAPLPDVARLTRHLWAERVVLISRKGPDWAAEVAALAAWCADLPHPGSAPTARVPASVTLLAAEPLGTRGTLVTVEVRGG